VVDVSYIGAWSKRAASNSIGAYGYDRPSHNCIGAYPVLGLGDIGAYQTDFAPLAVLDASGAPTMAVSTASGSALLPNVIITDVNTTESWDDGDTGLVITGTGFL